MKELDLEAMFAAGAISVASEHGMCEKDAEDFAIRLCKEARPRVKIVEDDDDDDEEGTWWGRNKGWVLPTGIGLGAFLLGGDAGRNGRKDWNYFSNAGRLLYERLQKLLGVPDSELWRSVTIADPSKLVKKDNAKPVATKPEGTPPAIDGTYPKGED